MSQAIKNTEDNTYYCVPMTAVDRNNEPTTGDNDFPYWSEDITDACLFSSRLLAEHEMKMNEFPDTAVIVDVIESKNTYAIAIYFGEKVEYWDGSNCHKMLENAGTWEDKATAEKELQWLRDNNTWQAVDSIELEAYSTEVEEIESN